MRSVSWKPGWSELTVTPSPATSRASVLRNAVSPERATLERISPAIGWRTPTDVIASTLPHRCSRIAGTASPHIAMRAQAVELDRGRGRPPGAVDGEVAGGRTTTVAHEDVDAAERVARVAHERRRALLGGDVGDQRHRAADRSPPPRPRSAPATGCRSATVTPSSARAAAVPKPEPARRGRDRGRGDPRCRSSRVDRPASRRAERRAPSRPVRAPMISAQIDTAVSSGVRAPMSRPIGAWMRASSVVGDARPRAAVRCAWRACVRDPIAPR